MLRFLMAVVQPLVASQWRRIAFSAEAAFADKTRNYATPIPKLAAELHHDSRYLNIITELRQEVHSGVASENLVGKINGGRLTADFVLDVLKSLKNDADTAWLIYKWAGTQEFYSHDSRVYKQIIKVLASANRHDDIDFVLADMLAKGCHSACEISLDLAANYANNGMVDRALSIFNLLGKQGNTLSAECCNSIFKILEKLQRYEDVYQFTEELMAQGFAPNASTLNLLIRIFCSTNTVDKAVWLLTKMSSRRLQINATGFGIVVDALYRIGKEDSAISLFEEATLTSGDSTLCCVDLIYGAIRTGEPRKPSLVIRKLVQKGLICGRADFIFPEAARLFSVEDIIALFRTMDVAPSAYEYATHIEGFCKVGNLEEALRIYNLMRAEGIPANAYTYNIMIECICKAGRVEDAQVVLEAMEQSDCKPDIYTYTRLINGFCRMGNLENALVIYSRMKDAGLSPDAVIFGCLINGFCKASKFEEALIILRASVEAGCEPDEVTYSSIIDPLCSMENWESALTVFELARQRGCPGSIQMYGRLINCLCKTGKVDAACILLQDLCNGENKSGLLLGGEPCEPNEVTFNTVVDGLCGMEKIDEAFVLVKVMEGRGLKPDVFTYTSFLHAFCRAGRIDEACKLLEMMTSTGCSPDVTAYNTLIATLCTADREEEACGLLQVMMENGCEPNAFTFAHLIQALCRSKRLEAAMHLFEYMKLAKCVPELNTYKEVIYAHYKQGGAREARRLLERESKAFSMNNPGKSLVSELHEIGSFNEQRQLKAILSEGRLDR